MSKFGDVLKSSTLVLVDFHATWCGPCKMLSPIISKVAEKTEGKVKVIKIDVDKNQAIASKLGIRGVPTLILYKNAEQVWRQSGVVQENEILGVIQQFSN